jgi:pimeloyl-ACP methyl ester carboxylesterase
MKKYSLGLMLLVLLTNVAVAQIRSVGLAPTEKVGSPILEGVVKPTPVSPNPVSPTGERTVVWVHGWEGSANSWGIYARKFGNDLGTDGIRRNGEREMKSFRVDYKKPVRAQTVNAAVTMVKQQVAAAGIAPSSQNIFIGHSLGGLTTRQIDKLDNGTNLYGGFITVGTPNKGAIIAKAVMEGKGDMFVNEGVRALVLPFYDTFVGSLLIQLTIINDRLQLIRSVFPVIGPAEDLSTTSTLVTGLNGFSHGDKKIITISARESGEKLWRELSSIALKEPSTLPLHQVADDELPIAMSKLKGIYNSAGSISKSISVVSLCYGNVFAAAKWSLRSKFFFNGASWIADAPLNWNNLLGANRMEQRTVSTVQLKAAILNAYNSWQDNRRCEPSPRGGRVVDCSLTTFLATLSAAQRADIYEPTTTTVSVPIVNENNDGIVLQSSANGLTEGPNVLNLEMELLTDMGVNHQECMNHQFVTAEFEKIFDGLVSRQDKPLNFKSFFTIPKR